MSLGGPSITLFPLGDLELLPPCAAACGPLYDANAICVPPLALTASSTDYTSCFCADNNVAPFSTRTTGVCDRACDSADQRQIASWFRDFCGADSSGLGASKGDETTTTEPARRTDIHGPLTTVFTQPPSCYAVLYQTNGRGFFNDDFTLAQARSCETSPLCSDDTDGTRSCASFTFSATVDIDCFPTPTDTDGFSPDSGFWSPGLLCPERYTTAKITTGGGNGNWVPVFEPQEGEVAAACCPEDYAWNYDGTSQDCIRTRSLTLYSHHECYGRVDATRWQSIPTTEGVSDTDSETTGPSTALAATSIVMVAPLFQINWRPSDLVTDRTTTTSPPETSTIEPENNDLSIGTQAGIGVGVGGFVLLGIALLSFWILRRRRGRTGERAAEMPLNFAQPQGFAELQGRQKYELHGDSVTPGHEGPLDNNYQQQQHPEGDGRRHRPEVYEM